MPVRWVVGMGGGVDGGVRERRGAWVDLRLCDGECVWTLCVVVLGLADGSWIWNVYYGRRHGEKCRAAEALVCDSAVDESK